MALSSEQTDKLLEKTKLTPAQQKTTPQRRYIRTILTPFQYNQIKALCNIGIARHPHDFAYQAVLEKIAKNKDFLPNQQLSIRHKRRTVKKKAS